MSDKKRWPWPDAARVAGALCGTLEPCCDRILIAGSLRRRKATVGDIEIVFVPRLTQAEATDFFSAPGTVNHAEGMIAALLNQGVIERRPNVNGSTAWGPKNKLAVHKATGIPVDLFTATQENWFNYIVCRTGGAESNVAVASAAQRKGWKWNPYGEGFTRGGVLAGEVETHLVTSERDV